MTVTPKKSSGFARPQLAPRPMVTAASADAAWQAGQEAENGFDFEAARDHYLMAVHLTPSARSLDAVARYAAFLVERLGAYDEAAAWLDDPAFVVPTDAKGPARALTSLLARAAAETHHPRLATLDDALVRLGDVAATGRTAQRLMLAGENAKALHLLERSDVRWPADSVAARLLEQLRQSQHAQAVTALQPVQAALDQRDVATAQTLLHAQHGAWGKTAAYHAMEARVRQAENLARAEALRAAIEAAIAGDQWQQAAQFARELAGLPGATESDRNWQRHAEGQAAAQELRARVVAAEATEGDAQLAWLADLAVAMEQADKVGKVELPFAASGHPLHRPWHAVLAAHHASRQQPLKERLAALPAYVALELLDRQADVDEARALLQRLPAEWLTTPVSKWHAQRIAQHDAALRDAEESAFVEAVQAMIDYSELDDATAALAEWTRRNPQPTQAIKAVRGDLQAARQTAQRRLQLVADFERALGRGAYFHARGLLGELQHLVPQTEISALREQVDAVAGPALRGMPMPPGVQKLGQGALACAVAAGRLLVVQDGMWLAVRLDTLGLQPFALPKGWEIQADAGVRVGEVDGHVRLTGLSAGRLVVIDQALGEPPHVQAAIDLVQALRGDDLLLGAALESQGAALTLLSRHSQKGPATNWTELDPASLEVVQHRRAQPALMSLAAVEHRPGHTLVVTQPRERQGIKSYALALLGPGGQVLQQWRDDAIGEHVGAVRKAMAWPDQDRIYASVACLDPFDGRTLRDEPSLLVIRGDRIVFASTDLRRRFAPMERITMDHAWTLDPAAGRLWFAALPLEGADSPDALLLGVDARTLRPDRPMVLEGAARVLALLAVPEGAVALCRMHAGHYALVRATNTDAGLQLTTHRLPL